MKTVLAINGSASDHASNHRLLDAIAALSGDRFRMTVFSVLKTLPHFDPALATTNTPQEIQDLRQAIDAADGIIICTPEYVFSIPSGLKNAIEWCVATTVFSERPVGLITASASGLKGHEELKLIMKTVGAHFVPETTLLISGIKSKVDAQGQICDPITAEALRRFVDAFQVLLTENREEEL